MSICVFIICCRAGQWDPTTTSPEEIFAANYLALEMMARESRTQVAGVVTVLDMGGFGLSQAMRVDVNYVRSVAAVIQNTFPLRFKEIHVIKESYLFDVVLALIKPFLSETIRSRVSSRTTPW
jgi:retinaldehyde-binding protein 1